MAYKFAKHATDSGLDSYLKVEGGLANLPHYTDPVGGWSLCVRFRVENVTADHTILKLDFSGGDHVRLVAAGSVANDPVRWVSVRSGDEKGVSTTTSFTAGTWHNVIVGSGMGLNVSLDGAAFASSIKGTINGTPTSLTISSMGTYRAIAGDVAEVAIWTDTIFYLTPLASDVATLAKGISPRTVRPAHLVHYWDLMRGLQDQIGGCTLTAFNSPTVSEHPRVIP